MVQTLTTTSVLGEYLAVPTCREGKLVQDRFIQGHCAGPLVRFDQFMRGGDFGNGTFPV